MLKTVLWLVYFGIVTSSKLNKTPPIGAPKATETPAAAAADKISLFFASFLPYLGNRYEKILPIIVAIIQVSSQKFIAQMTKNVF